MSNQFITGKTFIVEGRAIWPFLNKADTKFDAEGVYRVAFDVTPELRALLDGQEAACIEAAVAKLGSQAGDGIEKGAFIKPTRAKNETTGKYEVVPGEFQVEFKMKAKGKAGPRSPILVDAHRNKLTEPIFGGSLVKAAVYFQYSSTSFGVHVSPRLKGVQVLELVGPDGDTAENLFGEEDGFVTSGKPAPAPADTGSDEGEEF